MAHFVRFGCGRCEGGRGEEGGLCEVRCRLQCAARMARAKERAWACLLALECTTTPTHSKAREVLLHPACEGEWWAVWCFASFS